MQFIKTKIPEVIIIEPRVFNDERGYFFESFNQQKFEKNIGDIKFVQDNESKSVKGVLRGVHFQKPPYAQAKLVRCIQGKVLDVIVDIRKNSPTYGEHITIELSEENKKQVFVPRGCAHGYAVLSEEAIFAYKVDNYYAPEFDSGIIWNDRLLRIDWQTNIEEVILSEKDKALEAFEALETPFIY